MFQAWRWLVTYTDSDVAVQGKSRVCSSQHRARVAMPVGFLCTAFQACLVWCWPAGAKKSVLLFFSFILLEIFSAFQSLAISVSRVFANFLWLCFLQPFWKCTSLLLAFHETEFSQGCIMGFRNSPTATWQTVFARSDCACAEHCWVGMSCLSTVSSWVVGAAFWLSLGEGRASHARVRGRSKWVACRPSVDPHWCVREGRTGYLLILAKLFLSKHGRISIYGSTLQLFLDPCDLSTRAWASGIQ